MKGKNVSMYQTKPPEVNLKQYKEIYKLKAENRSVIKIAPAHVQGDIEYFQEVPTRTLVGKKLIKYNIKSYLSEDNENIVMDSNSIG